jgi:two-component system sensor histidine kinase/response regulator
LTGAFIRDTIIPENRATRPILRAQQPRLFMSSRILIVDDTQRNIQVLGTILREGGYQLNVAQDGQQALDSVERTKPDLILLDIMMPVMDGFETCKRLKANPDTAEIPIIFLTAKVEAEDIVKGFDLGAVDYVTKPFNAAELFVRVDSHLTRFRLQREVQAQLREIERMKNEQEFFVQHEIQSRVSPIVNALTQLYKGRLQNITETQRNHLVVIAEGVEGLSELLRLLEKLQDFQKGNYDPTMATVQLDQIVGRAISDINLTLGTLAEVTYQNPDGIDPALQADADLLAGAIAGLIKNAIEQVSGGTGSAEVGVELSKVDNGISVTVRHQKATIPASDIADFFKQLESGEESQQVGSPALTYAFLVAKAHSGTMTVEDQDSEWTTYRMTLPHPA